MNYQHAFHAGSFADVHKHIVLTRILEYLRGKPAAFRVIDSHAGAGRYDLLGPQATRSGEWHNGIERLLVAARQGLADAKLTALLRPYLDLVMALNGGTRLSLYPGSPLLARSRLRRQDRLIACEIEPQAAAVLKLVLRGDARVKVLDLDGWVAVKANVPPKERRGLVVIDPPYEQAADFTRLAAALGAAHRKWPTGIYLLWYPIKDRTAPDALAGRLRRLKMPKILRCELVVAPPRADAPLAGSGLIVVNPPYPLEQELRILLPALGRIFAAAGPVPSYRLDWLVGEAAPAAAANAAKP